MMSWDVETQRALANRRGALSQAIISKWLTVADRRYHVIRGFVDWSAWDFAKYPDAVAIQYRSVKFQSLQFNGLTAIFEIFNSNKYELNVSQDFTERFADTGLDRMYFDAAWVLNTLCEITDDNGQSVVQNIDYKQVNAEEVHDPQDTIQGVVVSAPMSY